MFAALAVLLFEQIYLSCGSLCKIDAHAACSLSKSGKFTMHILGLPFNSYIYRKFFVRRLKAVHVHQRIFRYSAWT